MPVQWNRMDEGPTRERYCANPDGYTLEVYIDRFKFVQPWRYRVRIPSGYTYGGAADTTESAMRLAEGYVLHLRGRANDEEV